MPKSTIEVAVLVTPMAVISSCFTRKLPGWFFEYWTRLLQHRNAAGIPGRASRVPGKWLWTWISQLWNNVTNTLSADPGDCSCIHISDLKECRCLWRAGFVVDIQNISHAPCIFDWVGHDHCHAWLDMQKYRITFWGGDGAQLVHRNFCSIEFDCMARRACNLEMLILKPDQCQVCTNQPSPCRGWDLLQLSAWVQLQMHLFVRCSSLLMVSLCSVSPSFRCWCIGWSMSLTMSSNNLLPG